LLMPKFKIYLCLQKNVFNNTPKTLSCF